MYTEDDSLLMLVFFSQLSLYINHEVEVGTHAHHHKQNIFSNRAATMSNSGSDLWGKITDITYVIVLNNSTDSIGPRLGRRPGKSSNEL